VPPVAVGQKVSENKVTPAGMSPHNQVDAGEGTQLTGQAACQLVVMKVTANRDSIHTDDKNEGQFQNTIANRVHIIMHDLRFSIWEPTLLRRT